MVKIFVIIQPQKSPISKNHVKRRQDANPALSLFQIHNLTKPYI